MNYTSALRKLLRHPDKLGAYLRGVSTFPHTVEVDLSYECNLKCRGCDFAYTHQSGPEAHMPISLAWRLAEQLRLCGVRSVVVTGGGEPFCNPQAEGILDIFLSAQLRVGVYTNGTLIDEGFRERFGERLDWVVCSAALPPSGPSGRCVWSWRRLVGPHNWHQLERWIEVVDRRPEIDYLQVSPLVEPETDPAWVDEALAYFKGVPAHPRVSISLERFLDYRSGERPYGACRAFHFTGMVGADGEVWLCCNHRQITSLGNILERPLASIWGGMPKQKEDLSDCRVCCRGHDLNKVLHAVCTPHPHEDFL